MTKLFVWVPGKGWKHVRSFRTPDAALAAAREFLPLEVKVSAPGGLDYYGGRLVVVNYSSPAASGIVEEGDEAPTTVTGAEMRAAGLVPVVRTPYEREPRPQDDNGNPER